MVSSTCRYRMNRINRIKEKMQQVSWSTCYAILMADCWYYGIGLRYIEARWLRICWPVRKVVEFIWSSSQHMRQSWIQMKGYGIIWSELSSRMLTVRTWIIYAMNYEKRRNDSDIRLKSSSLSPEWQVSISVLGENSGEGKYRQYLSDPCSRNLGMRCESNVWIVQARAIDGVWGIYHPS